MNVLNYRSLNAKSKFNQRVSRNKMENKDDLFYNNLRMKYKMQIISQPQKD